MKILIASDDVTHNCGIPTYNRELIKALSVEHELHILTEDDIANYDGCTKVISTAGHNRFETECCRRLVETINSEKYDIIINSKSFWMSLLAPYISDKTKIVSISHSMGTIVGHSALFNHRYIDSVVALSENCKRYICQRYGVANHKVQVVFNSMENYPDSDARRERKKADSTLTIVFAGGSAPTKSPELVLEILKRLQRTDLDFNFYWLACVAPPLKVLQPFENVSAIIPADPRIHFIGQVSQPQAAEYIAQANIFLCPSRREGFPMALLEALRVGCIPVVSDYKIANMEIINHGNDGFIVNHRYPDRFVSLIKDIICHHGKYSTIYDNSYLKYCKELSIPVWTDKMQNLFAVKETSHTRRHQTFDTTHFFINRLRFKILMRYSLIENLLGEVLPCALKIRRLYKSRAKD